jgi:hypothetical protein
MKTFYTIIGFLLYASLYGQTKLYNIPILSNGDTSYNYRYLKNLTKQLSLAQLDTSTNNEYFRLWTNKQVIDIWQNEDRSFSGRLTNWTTEYFNPDIETARKVFVQSVRLNVDSVNSIKHNLFSGRILQLPTDDSIPGWNRGVDGITYFIEYSTKKIYSLKSYWTPKVQASVTEAKLIQSFIDSSLSLANSSKMWESFKLAIPFSCYTNGIKVTCITR